MKEMDKRNINILQEIVKKGEIVTARQALDMLVEYQINRRGKMNYIPNVNRMNYILKQASGFSIGPRVSPSSCMRFVRVD